MLERKVLLFKNREKIAQYRIRNNHKLYDRIKQCLGSEYDDDDMEGVKRDFENLYDVNKDIFIFSTSDGNKIVLHTRDLQKNLPIIIPFIKDVLTKRKLRARAPGMEWETEEHGNSSWSYVGLGIGALLLAAAIGVVVISQKD